MSEDKANSFGELGRRDVIQAVATAADEFVATNKAEEAKVLRDMTSRLFVGETPTTEEKTWCAHATFHFPKANFRTLTCYGAVQGAAESTALQALTYSAVHMRAWEESSTLAHTDGGVRAMRELAE